MCIASPGNQTSSTSSSSSSSAAAADNLSKFYQSVPSGGTGPTGYMGPSAAGGSSCVVGASSDQRAAAAAGAGGGPLVAGFTPHGYYTTADCLSSYPAYSYPGPGGGSCLESYLKVRPSPYPCSTDYPSYFSRVAGLHHHHHHAAAAAAAASRQAGHVVGYDYPSA